MVETEVIPASGLVPPVLESEQSPLGFLGYSPFWVDSRPAERPHRGRFRASVVGRFCPHFKRSRLDPVWTQRA